MEKSTAAQRKRKRKRAIPRNRTGKDTRYTRKTQLNTFHHGHIDQDRGNNKRGMGNFHREKKESDKNAKKGRNLPPVR